MVGTVETDSEDRAFTIELVAYVTSIALAIIDDTVSGALVIAIESSAASH